MIAQIAFSIGYPTSTASPVAFHSFGADAGDGAGDEAPDQMAWNDRWPPRYKTVLSDVRAPKSGAADAEDSLLQSWEQGQTIHMLTGDFVRCYVPGGRQQSLRNGSWQHS